MASKPFIVHNPNLDLQGLKLEVEEKASETIIHCTGKINAENSAAFQAHVRGLIPDSRGHVDAITIRIVLDLTNVTHVDSTGLGALLGIWTAGQRKGCDLELANLNAHVGKLIEMTKLDSVFKKMKQFFGATKP